MVLFCSVLVALCLAFVALNFTIFDVSFFKSFKLVPNAKMIQIYLISTIKNCWENKIGCKRYSALKLY